MMHSVKESFFSYTNFSSPTELARMTTLPAVLRFGFENENVGGGRKRVWMSPTS